MKIFHNMLVGLLFASSVTMHINGHQSHKSQPTLAKKLSKAWQNNWVKMGTVTAACAVLYALGVKLNVIAPAALVCTGTPHCHACHAPEPKLTSNNLFWKTIGIISGLAACACGYAYYNAENSDDDYQELSDAQENAIEEEMEFNDDFFEFADEQSEVITNNQTNDEFMEIQNLENTENNTPFEDIIAQEEANTPSDIVAFENIEGNEIDIVAIENSEETTAEVQELINIENSITFEDIIAEEEADTPSDIIAFENFEDNDRVLPVAESIKSFLNSVPAE